MSTASRIRSKTARFVARLVSVAACICAVGAAYVPPAMAATSTAVPLDQQPLTVQNPLPPDIVLMLDDSGSMLWDVMPDYSDLSSTAAAALVNSDVNGVYYDPTQTYRPPYKVDGTRYPDASFTAAWVNGFKQGQGTVNLSTYDGHSDTSTASYGYSKVPYSDVSYYTTTVAASSESQCASAAKDQGATGYDYSRSWSYNNGWVWTCTLRFLQHAWFQYATGSTNTLHYVAASSCGTQSNCVTASDTSGVAAPSGVAAGTNIANWFAYYHTRILMAKSGLMNAFNDLDPAYRLGFASINNSNADDITALGSGNYTTKNSLNIANVAPFGDGSAGTQRANFWKWVEDLTPPHQGTPLRKALDAVGQYYQTKQPWETSTSDDTCHACRLAYTILTTDGFWNGSDPGVGDVDGVDGPKIQGPSGLAGQYTTRLPYVDQGTVTQTYSSSVYTAADCKAYYNSITGTDNGYQDSYFSPPNRRGRKGTCSFTWTGPGPGYSDTLADVAMKYWANDLRTDIANEVPTSAQDSAFWQHMTTFTLGLGYPAVDGDNNNAKLDIDGITSWANTGVKPADLTFNGWPKPSADSINNISDMAHAAINGHGGFYSADDPESFRSSLASALTRASQRNGTGASLAANSTELKQGTFAFQAKYVTSVWTGELNALTVDPTSGAIAEHPTWSASKVLPAAADRNIYFSTGTSMVAFKNGGSGAPPTALTSDEQAALGSSADDRAKMIDYLRGDSANELRNSGSFRNRTTPLGDIVDSQPVFGGPPSANQFVGKTFSGSDKFATYASDNASRESLIYVAANDGMLHAFNADTGVEKFAFLPAAVLTDGADLADGTRRGLSVLSHTDYGSDTTLGRHQFFNDGELTIADAYFGSAWHTVLVGTTGRGMAEAIYALDITDPTDIKFLWERSAHDGQSTSDYIGQMTGKPVIAQTEDGGWSVLMGNGYNSKNGKAALLQFDLADGTLHVHTTNSSTSNGLAAPAVWIGSRTDAISTVAYAGDLLGNVWSFDLYDEANKKADTGSSGTLVYVARDSSGVRQPITGGMLAGRNPDTTDLWVFFGTGRYLASDDLTDGQLQTWYGLIVESTTTGRAVTATSTRTSLTQQTILAQTAGSSVTTTNPDGTQQTVVTLPARVVSTNALGDHSGWYLDLQTPVLDDSGKITGYDPIGERMVTPSQFQGSLLVGTTRLPKALDVCNPSGSGWIMAVDPFTGGNPDPDFFDLNGDGVIDSADRVTIDGKEYAAAGVGFSSLPNNPIFVGGQMLTSFDNGTTSSIHTSGAGSSFKRVSWRELISD
ncbi:MAG TPA: PilC/PilY family type IV pilus protein [Frateuria sp.]|uniref:pilus assembly protein n=1 Tax=Frateuria sp. TaxID=2211372 RepID=UPI002D802371|nr:PilC/PilY family type IV pilus protein [Frateuria sp.]HET6805380.1 PilC/PilY family type IV pilus protein [Frateuria sp.]